jgi:hypothetical protein
MRRTASLLAAVACLAASLIAQPVKLPRAKEPLDLRGIADAAAVQRWTGLPCAAVTIDGRPGMRFQMPQYVQGANEWPAVYLAYAEGAGYTARDWSHYGRIAIDVWTDGDKPRDLALEFRDRAGQTGHTVHCPILPGKMNHIELPLADVGAEVNLEHIEQLVLFCTQPPQAFTLTVAGLQLLPGERPPLATFDLVYPNYRGLVFPTVERIELTARIEAAEYDVRPDDLELVLSCSAEAQTVTAKQRFTGALATAVLRTATLPPGALVLSAELRGSNQAVLAEQRWPLRKLTSEAARGVKVYIDENNTAIVDGKPFFPLGWYGNGQVEQALEIADGPFNCILDYGTNARPRKEMLAYLDLLQQKGLKLIYCLNDLYPTATYYAERNWEGIEGNDAIAAAVVPAYRDHPALLAWYLNDELPRTLAPDLTGYYQRVRDADPNHPCYIVLCNMAELGYFPDTMDVLGVDPYPIPQTPITMVSDWMDKADRAVGGHRPVWLVPQAFAWYQHHPKGSDRARVPSAEDLRTGRAPTYEESRCMTYLALAHGAKGLIYWCYYNLRMLPQYNEMWNGMKKIGAEVRALEPALLSPEDLGPVACTPATAPIHTRLKRQGGQEFLIAVNAGTAPCEVALDLRHPAKAAAEVLFEQRQVKLEGALLRDRFQPLEVHVYRVESAGAAQR